MIGVAGCDVQIHPAPTIIPLILTYVFCIAVSTTLLSMSALCAGASADAGYRAAFTVVTAGSEFEGGDRVVVQKVLDRSPVRMRKIDDDAIGRFSKTTCKTVVNDRCEISGACCQLRCAQYWSFALVAQTMVET